MKLYLSHSSGYDYETDLYAPLKLAFANEHEVFLPHETYAAGIKSKDIIPKCDAVIAEVSLPSTGQGIELGWADASNIPIICIYKSGSKPSSSIRFISANMLEYKTQEDMISNLRSEISRLA